MPVTETLMKPGSFQVNFVEDTPNWIRTMFHDGNKTVGFQRNVNDPAFGFFGHLFITPIRLSDPVPSLTTLLTMSRYTGVMRRRLRRGIAGAGLGIYFGDETGNIGARWLETAPGFPPAAQGFADWIHDIVNDEWASSEGDPPYDVGTITDIGSKVLTLDPYLMTRKAMLDYVCTYFGGEYRINADNTFDAGAASDLFVTTPFVVITPKGGVRDVDRVALEALALDMEVDFEDLQITARVVIASGGVESAVHGGATFKDLKGNANVSRLFEVVLDAPNVVGAAFEGADFGESVTVPTQFARREIRTSVGGYDVGGYAHAGDAVHIFDPANLIFDLDNQVNFNGQIIYPMALRLMSITWPIQSGMGVYYRISGGSNEGVVVDLTDYVAWDEGGASLSVAHRRPIEPRQALPAGNSRVFS